MDMLTLLILINSVRLKPLVENPVLTQRAQVRAEYLCTHTFSHDGWKKSFIGLGGGYQGENLAKDFPNDLSAHNALMASPFHKANIVKKEYKKIGIGRACGIIVELFSS